MEYTQTGNEWQFHGKLVKFHFEDFKNYFDLENQGMEVCLSNAPDFDHIEFVKVISKSVNIDHLDTTIF